MMKCRPPRPEKETGMIFKAIADTVLLLIMLAVLELNKNTVLGFVLLAAATAGYEILRARVLDGRGWFLRLLGWLAWIGAFAAVLFLTWPPVRSVPAYSGNEPSYTGEVSVSGGRIRGVYSEDGKVEMFTGIPYASPPVGELRWKEPQDPEPWDGVKDCDHYAPMSMQPRNLPIYDSLAQVIGYHDYRISLSDNWIAPMSEDSLYLNVWKPAGDAEGLPVLVFIHGGSLQTGQTWYGDYSGKTLAESGVVVVNMAYRLGVFGFYADEELAAESPNGTTGDYGRLDQIKALEWVRDNISSAFI